MRKYKVSVIVPVYNVERYLKQCLESLVNQTLDSLQIIVVNDGSTDESQKIIDQYMSDYPQKVFGYQKENGGLGDARNFGMQFAEGEYIGFVDSDDWVDHKMFEQMYEFANAYRYQIVVADMYCINDGWKFGTVAKEYRGESSCPTLYDFILNCLNPAHACGKLFQYQLMKLQKFPAIWYEDMATIPIIMSYAETIGYLEIPFYYYRQREDSITKCERDDRTLQVMQAWDNIIEKANTLYQNEVVAAVYQSVNTFIEFKPEFAEEFLEYIYMRRELFEKNEIIKKYIISSKCEDLFTKQLIPKKIHYFWFGGGKKNELFYRCLESWKKYAPDFEIIEWNETNCDINVCAYVKEAYEAKKWAFVADYFRVEKLYEYGGIYVDTDIEFMDYIYPTIINNTFFAFETKKNINAAIFGTIPHTKVLNMWLETYKKDHLLNMDGSMNTSNTIGKRLTKILKDDYKAELNGKKQKLKDGILLYQPNEMTLDMYDKKCLAQHHYEASWWDVKAGNVSYKYEVLRDYFGEGLSNITNDDIILLQTQIHELKNSTSWKLTKPVRWLGDLLKNMRKL